MLVNLAVGLSKAGCRPIVGVFRDSRAQHLEVARHASQRGVPVEIVHCKGRWDGQAVARVRRLLHERDVTVLHTHGYKADVIGCAAAWPKRTALVATCHNWPDPRLSMRAYAVLDRLVLRLFDEVTAASEPVAVILRRWGMPRVQAMPNGVEMARFRDARPTLRHLMPAGCDRIVGFAGRMVPEKGGATFLRCARKIVDARPATAFLLAGDGPCRQEWEALAAGLGLARNVVFAGVRDDMPGVYASLDMLVLPSLLEATPMCLLEALAASLPVVATRVGSVPDVVIPDVTGILVEPGDADGLAAAVHRLLQDPDAGRRMALQGRAHVERRYSAESTAEGYAALYERAVLRRAGLYRTS